MELSYVGDGVLMGLSIAIMGMTARAWAAKQQRERLKLSVVLAASRGMARADPCANQSHFRPRDASVGVLHPVAALLALHSLVCIESLMLYLFAVYLHCP